MSSVHVARQGFITKSALPSVSRVRGTTQVADNRTVLLLNGNGTNGAQNNTFVDSSTNNFTITRNGNATQGSFSPFTLPDGQWSNFFAGGTAQNSLTLTNTSVGTGNFTIEGWIYPTSSSADNLIYDTGTNGFVLYLQSGGQLGFLSRITTTDIVAPSVSTAVSLNTWTHVAVVRSGTGSGQVALYINGISVATGTSSANFTSTTTAIGARFAAVSSNWLAFSGYISNVRSVVGTAVYTSAFTPSTTPLTAITNTSLLTCQDNRFVDRSSNNFAITRNGDVRVTPWSPFAPTSAYDPATNGGSGYFDGTGDFINTATSGTTLSGDFTIEGWVYINALGAARPLVCVGDDFQSTGALFFVSSAGRLAVYGNNTALLTGTTQTVVLSSWNHIAFVRSSGTITVYLNGVADSTTAINSTSFAGVYRVGSEFYNNANGAFMNGYIANFRTVAGTAVYTSAFTPPTAPVTNITNTSLLLNFTNAGIFDTAGDNVIETVGNAQIDTAVKKYGSGSLEFDGTGDYLFIPNDVNKTLGTGDYTIEFWVYANNWTSTPVLLEYGRATTGNTPGLEFYISNTSGKLDIYGGSATGTLLVSAGTNISTGSWTHIALTRASGSTKLFLNGTQTGSTATDTTNYTQATAHIGSHFAGALCLNGYIDDLRVTKGVARYTANFTPPTAELIVYGTTDNIVNNSTYGVYQLA
jgi:hypothetical protein